MFDAGDALLYTVSAWRRCTWSSFRDAVDDLQLQHIPGADRSLTELDKFSRQDAARVLHGLGHCDVFFTGAGDAIYVSPCVLAALPVAGVPRAVLCGSRSATTLDAVREAVRRSGTPMRVSVESQTVVERFAPARIEVRATTAAQLLLLANTLGITYQSPPPACTLVTIAGTLAEYVGSLGWTERPDTTWARTDFDPAKARFAGRREPDGGLVLARYRDPIRGTPVFWLWNGATRAVVRDPDWARYAVLAQRKQRVLKYDAGNGTLLVPAGVPLPRPLSRAVTLCSGHSPRMEARMDERVGVKRVYRVVRDVPEDIYSVCARSLGQAEN